MKKKGLPKNIEKKNSRKKFKKLLRKRFKILESFTNIKGLTNAVLKLGDSNIGYKNS